MEIVTRGCTLPVDIVIGNNCLGGSILLTLLAAVGLTLVFGLLRFGGQKIVNIGKTTERREADHAIDQLGRTLRCLIAMAAADGRLDDREVLVIRHVGAHYFGYDFGDQMIRDLYKKMGKKIDVEAEINGNLGGKSLQDEDAIHALFHGVVHVAACDGEVSKNERDLLQHIGQSLRLKRETIDAMIDKARAEAVEWASGSS